MRKKGSRLGQKPYINLSCYKEKEKNADKHINRITSILSIIKQNQEIESNVIRIRRGPSKIFLVWFAGENQEKDMYEDSSTFKIKIFWWWRDRKIEKKREVQIRVFSFFNVSGSFLWHAKVVIVKCSLLSSPLISITIN